MFLNTKEILNQTQPVKMPDITLGDDISDIAQSTRKILIDIEEKQAQLESEQKSQKKINVAMLIFSIVAALCGLVSAITSVVLLF